MRSWTIKTLIDLVDKKYKDEKNKEVVYKFSKGRKFLTNDHAAEGIYSTTQDE